MMETDADRLESIKALGGVRIDTDAGFFYAQFDNAFFEQQMSVGIETLTPILMARNSDIARLNLIKDVQLSLDNNTYLVKRCEPTEITGFTRIVLKR